MRIKAWYVSEPPIQRRGPPTEFVLNNTDEIYTVPGLLKVNGPPVICCHGLHASRNPLDALRYGWDTWFHRVELWGEFDVEYGPSNRISIRSNDKFCATRRKHLWAVNAHTVLQRFTADILLKVVDWVEQEQQEPMRRFLKTLRIGHVPKEIRAKGVRVHPQSSWLPVERTIGCRMDEFLDPCERRRPARIALRTAQAVRAYPLEFKSSYSQLSERLHTMLIKEHERQERSWEARETAST